MQLPSRYTKHLLIPGFALAAICTCWLATGNLAHAQPRQAASMGAATQGFPASCPALLKHRFDRLQDEKPQSLCQYAGRVILVVNTASYCGFTGQYKDLEALYERYRPRGLVVLGFPANDFGRQEPGSNEAIADFCENTFGVKFPMFSKSSVTGRDTNPLYQQLAQRTGQRPEWNFHKYLIERDGITVHSFPSATEPNDPAMIRAIEKIISTK